MGGRSVKPEKGICRVCGLVRKKGETAFMASGTICVDCYEEWQKQLEEPHGSLFKRQSIERGVKSCSMQGIQT